MSKEILRKIHNIHIGAKEADDYDINEMALFLIGEAKKEHEYLPLGYGNVHFDFSFITSDTSLFENMVAFNNTHMTCLYFMHSLVHSKSGKYLYINKNEWFSTFTQMVKYAILDMDDYPDKYKNNKFANILSLLANATYPESFNDDMIKQYYRDGNELTPLGLIKKQKHDASRRNISIENMDFDIFYIAFAYAYEAKAKYPELVETDDYKTVVSRLNGYL